MHGDPKVNNVMLDTATGQAVGMVDLDTVKPGLVHYDIGDCLRSGCNPRGEETGDWEVVRFEPELCRAMLTGYLSLARDFLTETDYAYLYDAIRLLAFELGLRFFTDYLAGNVYFKARHPEHNLVRALVQFKLTESIESQATSHRRHHPGPEMNGRSFSLQPFSPIGPPLNFKITGHIARRSRQLAIRYDLRGDLAELVIPAPADYAGSPARALGRDLFRVFSRGQGCAAVLGIQPVSRRTLERLSL